MNRPELIQYLDTTYKLCLDIVKKKNADYAEDGNPFKNFENSLTIGVPVERGILVRIMDKVSRVSNLIDKDAQVTDESIDDTLNDVINYFALLKAYRYDQKSRTTPKVQRADQALS